MNEVGESINSAVKPAPRDAAWLKRHEEFVSRALAGNIDVLFLGDSLTDWWRDPLRGGPVWNEYFADLNAVNFGINGDRTQHLLWRLENGEARGFSPKVVVLLIGTNNTGMEKDGSAPRNSPVEVIEGVTTVLAAARHYFGSAKVLLHAIFPRELKESPQREQIREINEALSGLEDRERVFWIDMGDKYLDAQGNVREELMPDLLHLNTDGYRVWAGAIENIIRDLLGP